MAPRTLARRRAAKAAAFGAVALGFALASSFGAAAEAESEGLEVDLGACVELESAEERFACYERSVDAALRERGAVSEPAPAEPAPAADSEPTSAAAGPAPAPESAAPRGSTSAAPPKVVAEREIRSAPADDFGLHRRAQENEEELELFATISDVRETLPNRSLITLENGQIWRQTLGKRYDLRIGDRVRIYPGRFGGSYRMSAERLNGFIQVERVR